MKRKIIALLSILLLGTLIWYLFIKPYDYLVAFKVKAAPSIINQYVKNWSQGLNNVTTINQKNNASLLQEIRMNDSTFQYNWRFTPVTDSTSKVKVYIKDLDHSLINKIKIPFSETDFEKRTKRTLVEFNKKLNDHLKSFKVKVIGKDTIKGTYCAYVPIKTSQVRKARGMMRNYSLLDNFMVKNNLQLNGKPRIEITNWNRSQDSIEYNFCYPIIKSDSLPNHAIIKYKQLETKFALKAIYNGNYLTSDRAWYALRDYAISNNINILTKPIEVFYNNPNMGGDELHWKTEVFMPIE